MWQTINLNKILQDAFLNHKCHPATKTITLSNFSQPQHFTDDIIGFQMISLSEMLKYVP
jgi:hypothetical protein